MDEKTDNNFDEFQPILDAASNYEASKWVLGDAVLEICGPPGKPGINNGSGEKIKLATEFLQDNGIDFNAKYLTEMRDISHLFPAPKRLGAAGISWSVFREFRSCPQSLLGRIRKNPDLIMKVSEAKKIVADIKAAKEKEAAKNAPEETTTETIADITSDPIVSEPIETDAEDTQFVPDEKSDKEPKPEPDVITDPIVVAVDDINEAAGRLLSLLKNNKPGDRVTIEIFDSIENTEKLFKDIRKKLKSPVSKSKPVANGGDNVTPFPMAAGDASI